MGLLITARKMYTLFRGNRCLEVSTTANNRIRVSVVEPKIPAIFKMRNGERGTGNGERGTGNGERGIFKMGNL